MGANEQGLFAALATKLRDLQRAFTDLSKQPGPIGLDGKKGDTGPRGADGAPGVAGKDGQRGDPGPRGSPGKDGRNGVDGEKGATGDEGPIGPMPKHQWRGSELRFQQTKKKWGSWVDLRGPSGNGVRMVGVGGGTIAGSFTTLASSGNTTLGDATTDTLNVGNGGIVKDAGGNVGIGGAPTTKLSVSNSTAVDTFVRVSNSAAASGYDVGLGSDGTAYVFNRNNTPVVFGTNGTERMLIDSTGNVLVTNPAGLGYGTGAGGTVTQATSRTTGVTLSKPTGKITLFSKTATTGTFASFTLTNTLIAATDVVIVNFASATSADKYSLFVTAVAAGSCRIQVYNIAAVAVAEAPVINFAVIKGATS